MIANIPPSPCRWPGPGSAKRAQGPPWRGAKYRQTAKDTKGPAKKVKKNNRRKSTYENSGSKKEENQI